MFKSKSLFNYTNLFFPNDYEKNDKIFSTTQKMEKLYCVICSKCRKLKTLVPYIICSKCKNEDKKLFKEEESIEVLKIIGIIEDI